MVSSQLDYCNSLFMGFPRAVLLTFRQFKMCYAVLLSDWSKLVMSHPV